MQSRFIYLFCMCLCFPGSEPLHVHTSDLHTAPFANHACPSPHNTSVPSSSQQHSRLHTPPWSALHCWHWRYPGVHGRAHCWHQTPRSPHGPQPTGQPIGLITRRTCNIKALYLNTIFKNNSHTAFSRTSSSQISKNEKTFFKSVRKMLPK